MSPPQRSDTLDFPATTLEPGIRPARGLALTASALIGLGVFTLLLLLSQWPGTGHAQAASPPEEARLIQALRQGGVAVFIRHSETVPGIGDPPGFRLADCATQRNLSDSGRGQAGRIGAWFKAHGIVPATVRSSPWCRTRDTAKLAFGRTEDWTALSNLLRDRSRQQAHAAEVRAAVAAIGAEAVHVHVSHGVSISAFIDVYLQQGEMVFVRPTAGAAAGDMAGIEVLGRLMVP